MYKYGPTGARASIDEAALVQAVRRQPCLYNSRLRKWRCPGAREAAWRAVADEMNAPFDHCKRAWYLLRNSYQHAVNKKGQRTHKWRFEDNMAFLKPFVKVHLRFYDSGASETGDGEEGEEEQGEEEEDIEPHRRRDRNMRGQPPAPARVTPCRRARDELDLFFASIALTVKKLPPAAQVRIKFDVLRLVHEGQLPGGEGEARTPTSPEHSAKVDIKQEILEISEEVLM